jgi:CheY-like chemotaxis protein
MMNLETLTSDCPLIWKGYNKNTFNSTLFYEEYDMPKTILVVDDEDVVVDITKRKLTREGYYVIGVHDGESALQALREGAVDLIVLDVEMPKMNGYTFMSERKNIPGGAKAPVIMVTAYGSMEPIFKRHGIRAYLNKPLKFQDLLSKVKEVLAENEMAGVADPGA